MRRYGIIHAPVLAFYSRKFYRDVGTQWGGLPFLYLLLLLAACWLPFLVTTNATVRGHTALITPAVLSQVPEITIAHGEASADVAQPHRIIDPASGGALFVIDTTGAVTTLEETGALGLLTRRSLAFRISRTDGGRAISLKRLGSLTVTRQTAARWLGIIRNAAAPVLYLVALAGSFAFRMVQAVAYAVIALLFARSLGVSLPFRTLVGLSAMAITPVIIAGTLARLAGIRFPYDGVVYFAGAVAYLLLAVKAMAGAETSGAV